MVVASEVTLYSELLGDILVLAGTIVLLRHFLHHRFHHIAKRDCSCENHQHTEMSAGAIISTAAALSLHALAAGAIVREMVGPVGNSTLALILLSSSVIVGVLISVIVLLGDTERIPILRKLDKIPGVFAAILTGLCCFALYHTFQDMLTPSTSVTLAFTLASVLISGFVGYITHTRDTERMVQISSRNFN
jgi:drug/metabolite transporter (DMT)-like permease